MVAYYEMLLQLDASPAPRLGHAIAMAEVGLASRAKDLLSALLRDVPAALRPHTLAALARAHERLGEVAWARRRLQEAVLAAPNGADARMLARRAQSLAG